MKYLVYLLIFTLFTISCKKKKYDVTVTGRMLHKKDSTSASKMSFIIYQKAYQGHGDIDRQTVSFMTDENGYFSAIVNDKYDNDGHNICFPDNPTDDNSIKRFVIQTNDSKYDLGNVYY